MNKKTVLITGGSSGLGTSLVKTFSKDNYNVIFTYLTNEKNAKKLEKETNSLAIKCDITNEEDIINLKNKIIKKYGSIDILINNAAIAIDTTFEDKTKENFMKILEVNLVGTFLISKHIGDEMYNNKSGNIINISSSNGIDSYYEYSLDYDASKSGVINLTHNLANHYAPYVRVNAVCPGWINTPMNKNMDESFKNEEISKILLNRFAEPNEISELIYFLASDSSSYINDSIIKIDGGRKC